MAEPESLAGDEPLAPHLERHRTDRLIMLSDGIFAIATTLAALEVKLPERAASLGALLAASRQGLTAYLLSFLLTVVFWITHRELFARIRRTDTILTLLTLGMLCGIALIPTAVRAYAPLGFEAGFRFYCLVMLFCGAMNAAAWQYAAWRPGVMRGGEPPVLLRVRALTTLVMPMLFAFALVLRQDQIGWVFLPGASLAFLLRRVVLPRLKRAKAVDEGVIAHGAEEAAGA